MTIEQFIAKWKKAELKERAAAQEHFIDLCRLVGHPTPAEVDATGSAFCFEKGAAKHGGEDGFADVWKKGFFGWEYKGKRKDLEAAYDQLLRYKDALENPPLLSPATSTASSSGPTSRTPRQPPSNSGSTRWRNPGISRSSGPSSSIPKP